MHSENFVTHLAKEALIYSAVPAVQECSATNRRETRFAHEVPEGAIEGCMA